ncbi:gliding motility-associated C-terminal domain-containing protein [Flavobacterium branchiicola]|uniref:Gliding motility-associated C-terminal domain-containing protein n=1 Tax=Flavobacterium branchiicola TaxID=1114875 RepID=A0ABV9PCW7_9FLAO|nr:gliding motility-associated C-terminal domain-containing protein [Flavobacterium branchiicola]MBS7254295.1 gliding motility-associated C-terminal domain-containing protein [Flavobacterium branchiicola]
MKKNITYKMVRNSGFVLSFTLIALTTQNAQAQFVNKGDVKVSNGTLVSVYMDYDNQQSGTFINDGAVHIFQNWNNEGLVTFTPALAGKTFFTGTEEQIIENEKISNFQNVLFNNIKTQMPFVLVGEISVAGKAEFKKGIIDADTFDGLMIFKENAEHTGAGNATGFVDGRVRKLGKNMFEFPVGDEFHFRPSMHGEGSDMANIYTTQYFLKNSDTKHSHAIKEDQIVSINDKEYWTVTEDQGSENIVLSLTMDQATTPQTFFDTHDDTEVKIVRWDETQGKWINEGGEKTAASSGEPYSDLLTAKVSGYGMFTFALVKKAPEPVLDVVVYNAISPNDDGKNDAFLIENISKFPDNEVEIYNRWGVKVFGTKSYNESDNMFRGYSDGRATVNRGEKLPTGTYFYILKYNNGTKMVEKSGYLYINNQ